MKPRQLVFDLLQRLEKNEQFSNIILDRALSESDMSPEDKRLASALFYGVTERRLTLDYQISSLSSRSLEELDLPTLTALRMGLYQLIYMDKIPPHAAINESVELVKKKASGFVNAILRSYTRSPKLKLPSKDDFAEYLSVKYSVCRPLIERFIKDFGDVETEAILSGFHAENFTTLSVNTLKISKDELAAQIDGAKPALYSPRGLHVSGSIRNLYGYDDGLFFVQDEASQICVEALDARPGETVMDICSCPGSKSFGAAISMNNTGNIYAFDLHEKKLPLIVSGAQRLGITVIEAAKCDGRTFLPEFEGRADRVLCDVPCSGFGGLTKKPELRYKDPAVSAALPDIQLAILENACRYVKSGGTLVYSTCTVFPDENIGNVNRFLERHGEFTLVPFSVGELNFDKGYAALFPHIHGTDGFFVAKMIKR